MGDSAVEDLARMKGLRAVYFFRTRVTAVGLTKLHQAAPNLEFWHNVPAEQFSKIAPAQGEPMTGGMERPGARSPFLRVRKKFVRTGHAGTGMAECHCGILPGRVAVSDLVAG